MLPIHGELDSSSSPLLTFSLTRLNISKSPNVASRQSSRCTQSARTNRHRQDRFKWQQTQRTLDELISHRSKTGAIEMRAWEKEQLLEIDLGLDFLSVRQEADAEKYLWCFWIIDQITLPRHILLSPTSSPMACTANSSLYSSLRWIETHSIAQITVLSENHQADYHGDLNCFLSCSAPFTTASLSTMINRTGLCQRCHDAAFRRNGQTHFCNQESLLWKKKEILTLAWCWFSFRCPSACSSDVFLFSSLEIPPQRAYFHSEGISSPSMSRPWSLVHSTQ